MAIKDLIIKDCDKKFAEMVEVLHKMYSRRLRFTFEANFSGNPQDFKYYYSKIDINELINTVDKIEDKNINEIL
ncbi:MAG: hypothetical protein QXD05_00260 [Candidatus Pacearchaeota archaeon]